MTVIIDGSAGMTTTVGAVYNGIQAGTAVPYTSFTTTTYNDITSIPSWAKRITVMMRGISTSGTSNLMLQIGSGSVTSSGYSGYGCRVGSAGGGYLASTTGFILVLSGAAADTYTGQLTISLFSGNIYICTGMVTDTNANNGFNMTNGSLSLSGVLDRVRLTTLNGTDTFDAGTMNIMWE